MIFEISVLDEIGNLLFLIYFIKLMMEMRNWFYVMLKENFWEVVGATLCKKRNWGMNRLGIFDPNAMWLKRWGESDMKIVLCLFWNLKKFGNPLRTEFKF